MSSLRQVLWRNICTVSQRVSPLSRQCLLSAAFRFYSFLTALSGLLPAFAYYSVAESKLSASWSHLQSFSRTAVISFHHFRKELTRVGKKKKEVGLAKNAILFRQRSKFQWLPLILWRTTCSRLCHVIFSSYNPLDCP